MLACQVVGKTIKIFSIILNEAKVKCKAKQRLPRKKEKVVAKGAAKLWKGDTNHGTIEDGNIPLVTTLDVFKLPQIV